jgi:(p)ppGpp synthase/HD superfamily hydrolase
MNLKQKPTMDDILKRHPKWTDEPWVATPKNVVSCARKLATHAHGSIGQKRKYTEESYIVHPAAVAQAVRESGGTEEMEAAAWCHDVLEDTLVSYADVVKACGTNVAHLVLGCTDVGLNKKEARSVRQEKNRQHVSGMNRKVQEIKKHDLLHNLPSIVAHDASFARIWLEEKRQMVDVMTKLPKDVRASLTCVIENAVVFLEAEAVQNWLGKRRLLRR